MIKRLTYIDITRAILIAMVVFGHILNYANPQYDIIPYTLAQEFMNSFQMPAFFILSGMLTDGEKWRSRSARRILWTPRQKRCWCRICSLNASPSSISTLFCVPSR